MKIDDALRRIDEARNDPNTDSQKLEIAFIDLEIAVRVERIVGAFYLDYLDAFRTPVPTDEMWKSGEVPEEMLELMKAKAEWFGLRQLTSNDYDLQGRGYTHYVTIILTTDWNNEGYEHARTVDLAVKFAH